MQLMRRRARMRFTVALVVTRTEGVLAVMHGAAAFVSDNAPWLDVRVYSFAELSKDFGVSSSTR